MATLNYDISGNGIPLVLIHGFPLSSKIWDNQSILSEKCKLVLPDLPGSGKSAFQSFTLDSLAEIIHNDLIEIGIEKAVVMGHSMGGYLALAYAQKFPESLLGFGLISSHPFADTAEGKAGRQAMIDRVKKEGSSYVPEFYIPKIFSENSIKTKEEIVKTAVEIMKKAERALIIAGQESMMARPDRSHILIKMKVPVLLINGSEDPTVPKQRRDEMVALVPNSTVVSIQNSGHMPMMESPDEVNLALEHFISQINK